MARNEGQVDTLADLHELQATREQGLIETELTNLATIEPIPPNGGYGWICTLSVFLINAHTWGINSVSSSRFCSLG